MYMVFLILFFQVIYLTQENELYLRTLERKNLEKPNIELIIIGVVGLIFFIVVVIIIIKCFNNNDTVENSNHIKKKVNKKINLMKKAYLFQNDLKPKILKLKFPEKNFRECPICLENINENNIICYTPCQHIYHFTCFKNYMIFTKDSHCPLCKYDLFSLLQGKDINYTVLNINDNLNINFNNIQYEECFVNNLSSCQESFINNKQINEPNINNSNNNNGNINNISNNLNLNNRINSNESKNDRKNKANYFENKKIMNC